MSSEDTSKQAMFMMATLVLLRCTSKRCLQCSLARILLSVVHLLQKLLRLFLVDKGQSGKTVFEFEGVEEHSVLVISPCVVYFLIPDDSSISWRYVHHLNPVRVSHQVIGEHYGPLKSSVGPLVSIRVRNV